MRITSPSPSFNTATISMLAMKFSVLFLFLALSVVSVNGLLQPTVPGDGVWSGKTFYQTNGTARYVSIPQSLEKQEWTSLGSTITVEFWVNPSTFPSEPEGRWDSSYVNDYGEFQYLPVITRHIGFGFENQWAHFFTEFIRLPKGLVLVVYSGCGCSYEPKIQNGRQLDLLNCGYGYVLNSDNPQLALNNSVYIFPTETWTHVAFSLDGDNTDITKSKMGHLYVNGKLLFSNSWADPTNQPRGYNASACVDKPMQWFRQTGLMNTIRMGFFQNQDFNDGRVVNNLNPAYNFYGFNGTMDEIRIWKVVRTPSQIADYYDVALSSKEIADAALVAYYKFNSGPASPFLPTFSSAKGLGGQPAGIIVSNEIGNQAYNFFNSTQTGKEAGLIINPKVYLAATLINTPQPIVNSYRLPSFDANGNNETFPIFSTSFLPYNLTITGYSPLFIAGLENGTISISLGSNNQSVELGAPFSPSTSVNLILRCTDVFCSNLGGNPDSFPWKKFYFEYQAQGVVPSSLTARFYMNVFADCDGVYDACGVCNGDNRTCSCVEYHDFSSLRMSYELLSFLIEFLIQKVTVTTQLLEETLEKYEQVISNGTDTFALDSAIQTSQLNAFFTRCYSPYCKALERFEALIQNMP